MYDRRMTCTIFRSFVSSLLWHLDSCSCCHGTVFAVSPLLISVTANFDVKPFLSLNRFCLPKKGRRRRLKKNWTSFPLNAHKSNHQKIVKLFWWKIAKSKKTIQPPDFAKNFKKRDKKYLSNELFGWGIAFERHFSILAPAIPGKGSVCVSLADRPDEADGYSLAECLNENFRFQMRP